MVRDRALIAAIAGTRQRHVGQHEQDPGMTQPPKPMGMFSLIIMPIRARAGACIDKADAETAADTVALQNRPARRFRDCCDLHSMMLSISTLASPFLYPLIITIRDAKQPFT